MFQEFNRKHVYPSPPPPTVLTLQKDPNASKKFVKNQVSLKPVTCGKCSTTNLYSPDKCTDIVIKCSNKNCRYYICTLENCFKNFSIKRNAVKHHNSFHRRNADLNKCHFCKGPKIRDGVNGMGVCNNCGMYWCLVDNCTVEFVSEAGFDAHLRAHV